MKDMAKIRLFYSSAIALILPHLKDFTIFFLKLTCSISIHLSVCLSVYDCHKFLESLGQDLSIYPFIGLIFGVILTAHPNGVNKLIFNIDLHA